MTPRLLVPALAVLALLLLAAPVEPAVAEVPAAVQQDTTRRTPPKADPKPSGEKPKPTGEPVLRRRPPPSPAPAPPRPRPPSPIRN